MTSISSAFNGAASHDGEESARRPATTLTMARRRLRQKHVPPIHAAQARRPRRAARGGCRNVAGEPCRVADHGDKVSPAAGCGAAARPWGATMTYAGQRTILDADSHVMELPGFLDDFIESAQRDRLNRDGL